MENFRDFQIGPDPFGRTWHAQFKYQQNGISIRHSDSVDVGFDLTGDAAGGGERMKRVVVLHHPDLLAYTKRTGRTLNDTWCSRIAVCKLRQVIETAEDLENEYLPVSSRELEEYDLAIRKWEENWLKTHAA